MSSPVVAIIGAGLSGALCARQLSIQGQQVRIFEKSRGVGGRMATRRARLMGPDGAEFTIEFDHGAPDFDSVGQSAAFASWLQEAHAAGVLATWAGGSKASEAQEPLSWTGTPDMPALCRWLLDGQAVQTLCTIDGLKRTPSGWAVTSAGREVEAGFDAVVIAIPPAQAAALLQHHRDDWAQLSRDQVMSPCWTLMAVTDDPVTAHTSQLHKGKLTAPGASPLAIIIRQDTKPGRAIPPGWASWVAHAHTEWAQAHLEAAPEVVLPLLKKALQEVVGSSCQWHHAVVHRWRYAQFSGPVQSANSFWDPDLGLGLCGDAWGNGGIAGSWISASTLCDLMLARTVHNP